MISRGRAALACGVAVLMAAGGASAMAAVAPVPSPAVVGVLDGSEQRRFKAKQDGIELRTKVPAKVASFELTYPVGAESGWHSHPGIVIAVVKSGSVVRQVGCEREVFTVGDAFTEVGPHFVSNPATATEPAVLSITRVFPEDATVPRFEEEPPVCP